MDLKKPTPKQDALPGLNMVHCKSCGGVMEVGVDEVWQLQCDGCKAARAKLGKEYDEVSDAHKARLEA